MALLPATASFTIVDDYGISGQAFMNVKYDDTKTLAQLNTQLASDASTVAALSQGIITHVSFTITQETGVDPTSAVGDIEKGAIFNYDNTVDPYAYGILIPDVSPSILNADGLVDLANADVTAFESMITTAGTVLTYTDEGTNDLTGLRDTLITFRKHRKPLTRKTKRLA